MDTTNAVTQTPVITLSESALKEVKRLINVQGLTEGGLRLGVKGGGCSGLSYTINFDEKIGPHDQIQDFDGVKVIVDAKSAIYLQGTQLDFQKDLMGGNFKFVNPNADKRRQSLGAKAFCHFHRRSNGMVIFFDVRAVTIAVFKIDAKIFHCLPFQFLNDAPVYLVCQPARMGPPFRLCTLAQFSLQGRHFSGRYGQAFMAFQL